MRLNLLLFFVFISSYSQTEKIVLELDSLYREDQIYISVKYCTLNNTPNGVSQDKISLGFDVGFLRDFPINKRRNVAIAVGAGYSFKNFNNSLQISNTNDQINYTTFTTSSSIQNYFRLHHVDFPLEFRWRTSVPDSHKFWRIYTGFKLSYLFYDRSYYQDENKTISVNNNPDFKKTTSSVYISLGWNTWNVYVNYGLSPIFNTDKIGLNSTRGIDIGLIFYIL